MTKQKEMRVVGISKGQLEEMIEHWEKFAQCYFWSPPRSASGRRNEEKRQARHAEFTVDGISVEYSVNVTCSCSIYYCNKSIFVDGVRKVQGLRYLRKLEKYGVFEEE